MTLSNYNIPVEEPGDRVTGYVTAAVFAKRFLAPSADIPGGPLGTENIRVALCGAGKKAVGVSDSDASVIGDQVGIHCGHFFDLIECGAAVTAGQEGMSDSTGRVINWAFAASMANVPNCLILSTTAAAGEFALCKIYS